MLSFTSYLVLDDDAERLKTFERRLAPRRSSGARVVLTQSMEAAIAAVKESPFVWMSLDHDLGDLTNENRYTDMYGERELTGADFVGWLIRQPEQIWPAEVIIHSWNPDGAKNMYNMLVRRAGIRTIIQPFRADD